MKEDALRGAYERRSRFDPFIYLKRHSFIVAAVEVFNMMYFSVRRDLLRHLNIIFVFSFQVISNNCGDLCLVRVGRKSYIHPGVLKFSLDSMTKLVVDQSSSETEDRLNKTKESLAVIDDREKKLERKITKLKSSPHTSHEVHISALCCVFVCLFVFVGLLL